jgi:periplasmic protein TonB
MTGRAVDDNAQSRKGSDQDSRVDRDPFAAVLAFGSGAARTGLAVGVVIATLSHGAFGGRALASPIDMRHWFEQARDEVHGYLWAAYDVDMVKLKAAEPPKPEPPKPEEKPDPEQPTPVAQRDSTQAASPPPIAQAGKVLTALADPNEAVDFTGNTFVQGDAKEYVGGVSAAAGTGTAATYNPAASTAGRPGGTGTGPASSAPVVQQGPDRSKPPGIAGGSWSSCDFPSEADQDQVDYAVAVIVVTVRPDGSAQSVKVMNDPGHGFGRAARMCALSKKYTPAMDRDGTPAVGTTPPIHVTFTR